MNETLNSKRSSLSEFLNILFKWKKFLIINLFLISVISVGITLLIDNEYKASGTVIISSNSNNNMALGGMLSDVSSLLGVGGTASGEAEYLLGILGSRKLKTTLIDKFDLINYYEITKYKIDKTIKMLDNNYFYEQNENGMIDISFIHKDPTISASIVKFIINYVDSTNVAIHHEKARDYRTFIENRYNKSKSDLHIAEQNLQKFQEETGLYVIPDQLMVNIKTIVELEKKLYSREIELEILNTSSSPNYSIIKQLKREIKVYQKNLKDIKTGANQFANSTAFFPIENLPEIYAEYIRIYRDFEIKNKILEFITPMYEQALMDEQKNIPTLIVLDEPFIPELKEYPKRSSIVIIVFFLSLFILIPIVLTGEYLDNQKQKNIFEERLFNFFKKIKKIYFLRTM